MTLPINISIENLLVGSTFYTERLLNIDSLSFTKQMSDLFWGIASFSDVTLELDNSDNFVTDEHNATDLRGRLVTLTLYDKEDGSSQEIFNGIVSAISLGDIAKITVTDQDLLALETELPKRTVTTADFPNATDLGMKVPIVWGLAKKVKLPYIGFDNTLLEFDYLVGEKTIDDVLSVYRDDIALPVFTGTAIAGTSNTITLAAGDKKPDDYYNWTWVEIIGGLGAGQIRYSTDYDSATNKITVDSNWITTPDGTSIYRIREWRFYDGTQGTPYADFSFIRFKKRQSTGNRFHTITADVDGMQAERNWARAIRSLLSDSTWGLGKTVNATSFDAAEAEITAIGGLFVDGAVTEGRRAFDILNDLLIVRGGRLEQNNANEWTLSWDSARTNIVKAFGANDGKYNNIVSVGDIEYRDSRNATNKVTIKYRFDFTSASNEESRFKQTLSRNALSFGRELIIENQYIRDHTTADKLLSYVSKKLIAADRQIPLGLGPEAKDVILGNLISLQIPRYNIANPYDLLSVTNLFGEKNITAFPYDVTVYDYSAQTLPTDENPDTATDFSRTPPAAVTSLVVTAKKELNNDGSINSWFEITWTKPTSNYTDAVVELKKSADALYRDVGSGISSFKTAALEPGINYDVKVSSRNEFGLLGISVDALNQVVLGDSTAPATPGTPTGILKFRTWEWAISYTKPVDFSEFEWVITDAAGSTIQTVRTKSEKITHTESGTTSLTRRAKVRALDLTGNASSFSALSSSLSTATLVSGDVGSGQIGGGGGAGHIASGTVVNTDIVSLAWSKITSVSIVNSDIVSIAWSKITSVSIVSADIVSLVWSKITNVSIVNSDIVSVAWSKITSVSIVNADIVSIEWSKVTSINVTGANIASLTITSSNIGNLEIIGTKIATSAVDENKRIVVYSQTSATDLPSIGAGALGTIIKTFTHSLGRKPLVTAHISGYGAPSSVMVSVSVINVTTTSAVVYVTLLNNGVSSYDPPSITVGVDYW